MIKSCDDFFFNFLKNFFYNCFLFCYFFSLQSTNGVYVNAVKVLYRCPLVDGSIISFGPLGQSLFKYIFVENFNDYQSILMKSLSSQVIFNENSNLTNICTQRTCQTYSPLDSEESLLINNVNCLKRELHLLRIEKQSCLNEIISERNKQRKLCSDNEKVKELLDYKRNELSNAESQLEIMRNQLKENIENNSPLSFKSLPSKEFPLSDFKSNVLKDLTCSICGEYFIKPTVLNCQHTFCLNCIEHWKCNSLSQCPICREVITSQVACLSLESVISNLISAHLTKQEQEERDLLIIHRQKELVIHLEHQSSNLTGTFMDSDSDGLDDEDDGDTVYSVQLHAIRDNSFSDSTTDSIEIFSSLSNDNESDDDVEDEREVLISLPETNNDDHGVVISLRFYDPNLADVVTSEEVENRSNLLHVDEDVLIEMNTSNQHDSNRNDNNDQYDGSLTFYSRIPSPESSSRRRRRRNTFQTSYNNIRAQPYDLLNRASSTRVRTSSFNSVYEEEVVVS